MTGYSGGKKLPGWYIGIAPLPKSVSEISKARQDKLRVQQQISEFFLNLPDNLKSEANILRKSKKDYNLRKAELRKDLNNPNSQIRVKAEKIWQQHNNQENYVRRELRRYMLPQFKYFYYETFKNKTPIKKLDTNEVIRLNFYLYFYVLQNVSKLEVKQVVDKSLVTIFNYYFELD